MNLPPIPAAHLRAIFDPTDSRPERKESTVIRKLLSAALGAAIVLTAAPLLAAEPAPDLGAIGPLVSTCRSYVQLAYETGNTEHFDAYVDQLLKDRRRNHDRIVACGAYLAGAIDMAEGRIAPAQTVNTARR
jgi:hypothetical protein